ncbi:hypothetical protein ACRALDRAFT_211287, partial [Sodiomyces alcalophilus JCM 7366]|uniref:uncharacterized protein n=1 Tax=Sodiomyces alcalophilus JCM 7366 TaxID=591952 RepID=UPI0039B5ACD6
MEGAIAHYIRYRYKRYFVPLTYRPNWPMEDNEAAEGCSNGSLVHHKLGRINARPFHSRSSSRVHDSIGLFTQGCDHRCSRNRDIHAMSPQGSIFLATGFLGKNLCQATESAFAFETQQVPVPTVVVLVGLAACFVPSQVAHHMKAFLLLTACALSYQLAIFGQARQHRNLKTLRRCYHGPDIRVRIIGIIAAVPMYVRSTPRSECLGPEYLTIWLKSSEYNVRVMHDSTYAGPSLINHHATVTEYLIANLVVADYQCGILTNHPISRPWSSCWRVKEWPCQVAGERGARGFGLTNDKTEWIRATLSSNVLATSRSTYFVHRGSLTTNNSTDNLPTTRPRPPPISPSYPLLGHGPFSSVKESLSPTMSPSQPAGSSPTLPIPLPH